MCIVYLFKFFIEQKRADTVDLNDSDLNIDISDALSEKEKVKFTVHTKVGFIFVYRWFVIDYQQTKLPTFQESEFNVSRQHEEFIWLHDRYNENEEYAGLIVSIKRCDLN